jgi:hypothetical protein
MCGAISPLPHVPSWPLQGQVQATMPVYKHSLTHRSTIYIHFWHTGQHSPYLLHNITRLVYIDLRPFSTFRVKRLSFCEVVQFFGHCVAGTYFLHIPAAIKMFPAVLSVEQTVVTVTHGPGDRNVWVTGFVKERHGSVRIMCHILERQTVVGWWQVAICGRWEWIVGEWGGEK